ncbi:mitochondrial transcription rescue factor 1 [Aulostomus maculatus]
MRGCFIVSGWSSNMQSLAVQVLAMRQLGRLNQSHLLAAGYGLRQTEWSPRTIHTRQLWGCAASTALGCHRPALCGRYAMRSWSVHQLRFKSKERKGAASETREDEDEDEEDPEDSDYEDEVVDPNVPKDYKDMEKHVQSFRFDVIMGAGLNIARNKIEDRFYNRMLRLNGQTLIKKSKSVKAGDTLDLVLSESKQADTVTLMRVVLKQVSGETTKTEKHKVVLRRWKFLELSRDEVFKP